SSSDTSISSVIAFCCNKFCLISTFNSSSDNPCIVNTCSNSSPTSSFTLSSSASTSSSVTSYSPSRTLTITSSLNTSSPFRATSSSYNSSFVTFPAFVSATSSDEASPQAVNPIKPIEMVAATINFFIVLHSSYITSI